MRNLSTEFKEEQNNGNHRYLKFVDITLKNGTELHLDNSNLWNNGISFEEAVSSGDNFDIGVAIINKFSIVINNIEETFSEYVFSGARAVVYVGLELSTGIEKIRICTGTVSEEPKQKSSIINLTLLDNMSKFDRDYADVKTIFPATRNQIVRDICSVCGVTLQTVKFDHDDFIIQSRPDNEALTCRQMLAWVAQIGCQWAKCDEYGRLCIEWYKDISSEANNLINIKSITNMSVDLEDVVITGVKVTEYIENPSEDNPVKTYMYGKEGYVLSIAENKLITENTGNTIASIIGEKCVGMRFRPFSLNCITDISIEAGDAVKVTDRKGNVYLSYATNVKLQPGNHESISCGAESAERNSAKQYSILTQVEVAARKNIQKEKTEREKALEELAGRLENSPGVFTTVETDTGGGKIYYLHNKPKLSDSDMVWKMTAEAWAVSTDGGKTWNAGMTVDGDTIVRILNAVGVNADWIETGSITVRDSDGNIIFSVDMDAKSVIISGDAVRIGGRPVKDVIDSGIAESKKYSDKKLSDYANTVSKDLEKIQSQVDGQVEDWYFDYEPSMQNIPASQWTTTEERQKHIGDRFFWKSKGYAYRFMEDNGVWGWTLLQDTDITKAMQTAQSAKDTADGKRRTFVTTPQPPYDIGDLWTDGKDILTCVTARENGALYVSTDWEKLNDYTDDTIANQALEEAKKAHNLTISLDNDYQGIPSDHNGNITDFPTVKTHVTVFYGHDDVSASCTYSVQKSSSVAGAWDNTRREYTVTGLSDDTGWVDITANYMQLFTVTKRFNVAKNKDGAPGANGTSVTIVSKSVTYQVGASGTQKPIGEWEEAIPQVPAGQYLWTKTYVEYSNGEHTESYSVSYKAKDGENGTDGADGKPGADGHDGTSVTITSKSITYQASSSGTTPPTGEWNPSVPSIEKGQYLWTRTIVNYSDGTSTTSYSVGYQGTNGTNGTNGRNTATVYLYQRKSSTPSNPTNPLVYTFATGAISGTINNGWSTKIPSGTEPLYVIVATASSNTASYSIPASAWSSPVVLAQNGADGKPGVDGTNGKPGSNGTNGLNAATIYLYQRKTSVPAKPSAEITYTFATGTVSGLTNGWSKTIPSGTAPLYVILATAASTAASDTIAATEWSTPVVMAENGKPGADGSPGRTYFMELSSLVVKQSKDNTISPNYITMSAFYRDGTNTARTPYAGRFKIEESTDGNTWKTVYTSSENESSVRHSLYSVLSTQSGGAITTASGRSIGIPRDVVALRCTLYAAGGTTQMLDTQSAAVVLDVDALTIDEILDIITDNGKWQGFYKGPDNKIYVSFEAARGGLLKLGGSNNGNGQLIILNSENNEIGKINKDGASLQGKITSRRVYGDGKFVESELGPYGLKFCNNDAVDNEKFTLDVIPIGNNPYTMSEISLSDDTEFSISGNGWAMFQIVPYNNHEVKVLGNFKVESGTKSRIANTRNFDKRLLYCYETPTPMFGDMGCASTNEKGIAIVDIDPIFYETVNTNIEYQVFLQKEGQGDLWVEEKDPNYFIVNGTPNLKFSWEAKCIQKEFENLRLENEDLESSVSKDIWNAENDITKEIEINVIDYDKEMEELINESSKNY